MFNRNGFWIREFEDGRVAVLKVENDYDVYRYESGEWIPTTCCDLGMSAEWDKVSEEDAISRLKL